MESVERGNRRYRKSFVKTKLLHLVKQLAQRGNSFNWTVHSGKDEDWELILVVLCPNDEVLTSRERFPVIISMIQV